MIKVADINISDDGCGLYVLELTGSDASLFKIINKELYFVLDKPCKEQYTVNVVMKDIENRFQPKSVTYNLSSPNCECIPAQAQVL